MGRVVLPKHSTNSKKLLINLSPSLSRCSAGDEEPKLDEKEVALGGRRRLLRHPRCHLAPAEGDEELSEEPGAAEAEECRGITHTPISNTHTHTLSTALCQGLPCYSAHGPCFASWCFVFRKL